MFGPVLWLVLSSFKTQAGLLEFPPSLLPLAQKEVTVPGYPQPLPLFTATLEDGSTRELAQVRRVGIQSPRWSIRRIPRSSSASPIDKREPVREFALATENYTEPLRALRLPALSRQFGLRDGGRDADHAADQLDGGLCALDLRVPRARTRRC